MEVKLHAFLTAEIDGCKWSAAHYDNFAQPSDLEKQLDGPKSR